MEKDDPDRELVCILFPGDVQNDEKALQCLGGIRNISQIYSQPTKKRLGLSFQPDNPFVKKIYGDMIKTAGVLLKVRVKKVKVENTVKREVVSTSIVGRVKKIYKFECMCDFQYLTIDREGDGPMQCVLEKIIPSGLEDISYLDGETPLNISPANFTRSDKPTKYAYTDKRYITKDVKLKCIEKEEEVHMKMRAERKVPVIRFEFNLIDDLPTQPHEYYLKAKTEKIKYFPTLDQDFETVKKLFEERPVWSQNLIRYKTKVRVSMLKIILPCLGIYMTSGPWRMLWVRYGYDPRKEPGARIYQGLDFRLRHHAGVNSMVMTRNQIQNYKKADRVKQTHRRRQYEALTEPEVLEGTVLFRPGMVPSQRQIIYMYCDVEIPEIKEILAQEPPPGYLCHQKRGWLSPNTDQTCRDLIFKYVKKTLLATHNTDLKFEQGSSGEGEGSNSEDNDDADADSLTDEPSTSII